MKNIKDYSTFKINESTAAGNRWEKYNLPFSYSSRDTRDGYSSKAFADDLSASVLENPKIKKEILTFLSDKLDIIKIEDLAKKPFSYIKDIIPEIERIIKAEEYEPDITMPGGALLFIRGKKLSNGKKFDFYINRKGTKIEVSYDIMGGESGKIYHSSDFPFDKYEFSKEEEEELLNMIKAKGNKI
jgi:hypothetical protein